MRTFLFWTDAMLCFVVPRAARWTAALGDRADDQPDLPVSRVRFRRKIHAMLWVSEANIRWKRRLDTVEGAGLFDPPRFVIRPIR